VIAVAIVLTVIAFLSLLFDTGYIISPRIFPIILDIFLIVFSIVVLIRSVILYRIGEKEMLSKKVRDLEAKVDLLSKKERERMDFEEIDSTKKAEGLEDRKIG
jgi:hypothetical protein